MVSEELLNVISGAEVIEGYKTFSCLTQLSMKLILLINVKMPTFNIYGQDK